MTGPDEAVVFERVQACLEHLVGGSGHLASYGLDRGSFDVTATRDLDDGCTEFEFVVQGGSVTEFSGLAGESKAGGEPDAIDGPERLTGTIVLDEDGSLTLDEEGRVRIEPWRTLDPRHWPRRDDEELQALMERFGLDEE